MKMCICGQPKGQHTLKQAGKCDFKRKETGRKRLMDAVSELVEVIGNQYMEEGHNEQADLYERAVWAKDAVAHRILISD